jgi:ketosteroid isomerase-like protein
MSNPIDQVTVATLKAFSAAWNRHDIDALMSYMTEDCIFMTAAGPDACGTRHVGNAEVRAAFESAWLNFPDAMWINDRHFVEQNFGVSEWTFIGTSTDGSQVEADGVDIFTFKNGKIQVKNAFRKNRPNIPAAK